MIATTLNRILMEGPCEDGYEQLLRHLGKTKADDDPLPLLTILYSNGPEDCIWCLRTVPEHNNLWRHFAIDCAEQVRHLMTDDRSLNAIKVARKYAFGLATDDEFAAARAGAARAARATRAAARAAARSDGAAAAYWATVAARDAAWPTDAEAAWATARAAYWAAEATARAAARKWQEQRLRELLTAKKWSTKCGN